MNSFLDYRGCSGEKWKIADLILNLIKLVICKIKVFLRKIEIKTCLYLTGGGNVMCVCLYQKSVCKVYRTEGVYYRYIQYIRISVFVESRRVHLFIVNCLLKNKFNIHVVYYLYTQVNTISQIFMLRI